MELSFSKSSYQTQKRLTTEKFRDLPVDVLRGFAIAVMVAANMSALSLLEPHPLWFRIVSSIAAPLFIFLSGMMVPFGVATKTRNFRYYLLRGGLVVLVGVLIDVCVWQIYPFMTYDVLYLTGLALPLTYLYLKIPIQFRWLMVALLIIAAPLLQKQFGYADYPTERYWATGELTTDVANQTSIFNHWLVDGWFPLFPWLAVALLGAEFGVMRYSQKRKNSFFSPPIVFVSLIAGIIVVWRFPGQLLTRGGYSELFYEPTVGFVVAAIAICVLLFFLADAVGDWIGSRWLALFGQSSLFFYIFHSALLQYVVTPHWSDLPMMQFLHVYAVLMIILLIVAVGLQKLKIRFSRPPFLVRFLIG